MGHRNRWVITPAAPPPPSAAQASNVAQISPTYRRNDVRGRRCTEGLRRVLTSFSKPPITLVALRRRRRRNVNGLPSPGEGLYNGLQNGELPDQMPPSNQQNHDTAKS